MKVLVVDDDPLFRRLLANLLAHDYDVVSANDGEQAWEVLCRPDRPAIAAVNWMEVKLDAFTQESKVSLPPA